MLFKKTSKIFLFIFLSFVGEMQELFAQQVQEVRKVGGFENIILEGSANTFVYVSQEKIPAIKVKTDQQHLSKIKTTVSEGTLTIFLDTENLGDAKVEIYVNLPVVKRISILGGGNVELIDGSDNAILQTSIRGGGNILIKDQARVHTFQGQISGGGSISALSLDIKDAKISVTGGGAVLVQVENRLDGSIDGGGSILYTGRPEVFSAVSGGGRIARR
ncbi:MAG: hypothetical protein C0490_01190 [Marivirga sp.]|nr:hypothetical protein [Marivirga sp.]